MASAGPAWQVWATWQALATWLLLAFAIIVFAIRFASPILDSDLFWQMAYARQMLERGTLVLDHTAFSWTPTSNAMVYCAWLAQFALYGLWTAFGINSLFALVYAALALNAWLLWRYARRRGLALSPFVVWVLLLVTLASGGVASAKPELFSVVFTHVLLWSYFQAKHADQASERGAVFYLALLPVTLLVWVNTHGGFILAAPVLAAIVVGELINRWQSNAAALSVRNLRWLLAACGLCAMATLATPYGPEYPRQLIADYLLNAGARPDVAWNNAYQSIFSTGAWQGYSVHLLVVMLATLAVLIWPAWRERQARRMRPDFVPLLLVLCTLPLYLLYLRSMYVFVAVFGYVAVWLATPGPGAVAVTTGIPQNSARAAQVGCGLLVVALGTFAIVDSVRRPYDRHGWLGFGVSTLNPVEETAYLERAGFRGRLYNSFETGGYLLWKLQPKVKVLVDARSFPYLSWFNDQYRWVSGDFFDAFLGKYPGADVALIDYAKGPLLRNFARSPHWQAVFIGPGAAVFVRRESEAARRLLPETSVALATLRNAAGALALFDFARFAGDYRAAWVVVDQLQSTLALQARGPQLAAQTAAAIDYRRAHRAARSGYFTEAFDILNTALHGKVISEQEKTTLALLRALSTGQVELEAGKAARLETWLQSLLAPLE